MSGDQPYKQIPGVRTYLRLIKEHVETIKRLKETIDIYVHNMNRMREEARQNAAALKAKQEMIDFLNDQLQNERAK